MGSRERKRAARQKRKTRTAERKSAAELAEETIASTTSSNGADSEGAEPALRTETASQRKDREAREALEPLREGERPTVVTVGAVISAVIAVSVLVAYALGAEVDGERPPVTAVLAPAALLGMMAYGLWRARYWAVLGFQALLVILILATSLGLLQAVKFEQVIGNLALLAAAGVLFWFMIKAWARIQMPTRLPRE
ncbi:MAG TPA: hypothetical protein VFY99_00035 [Solirubrobacterales bacterium]